MRILLAVDGSTSADMACRALASTRWPIGTTVRVVAVAHHLGRSIDDGGRSRDHEPVQRLRVALDAAERLLGGEGRPVEPMLLEGRPASAIVEEAATFDADLIVVGSRGHGPWQSLVLGSVSAEVVDHAPCPVLVVRGDRLEPIVFADDGSEHARRAEAFLARWPRRSGVAVTVVSVAPGLLTTWALTPGAPSEVALRAYALEATSARQEAERVAEATAGRLRAAGLRAATVVRAGDPATEIVGAVRDDRAGLVVVGTRGQGGMTRLLLGSVARNVLLHAPCSVLVVRPTTRRIREAERGGLPVAAAT
jgi:nucleotide-binding universal stress UspA family protein